MGTWRLWALVTWWLLCVGLFFPFLFSAANTELVIAGFLLAAFSVWLTARFTTSQLKGKKT